MTAYPFRNKVTHKPLPVSDASANVVVRALVAARDAGRITDNEYAMTYAEICEVGRMPQAYGGCAVDPKVMEEWQRERWDR